MKLLLSFLTLFALQLGAQTPKYITFKDGVKIPIGDAIKGCLVTAKQADVSGLLDENKYCDCSLVAMGKNMTYKEMKDMKTKDSLGIISGKEYILTFPNMKDALAKCAAQSIDVTVKWTPAIKITAKQSCKNELSADETGTYDGISIDSFCDCYIDRVALKMTYGKYYKTSTTNPDDDELLGIITKCMIENAKQ
jgi:hypothetical protein